MDHIPLIRNQGVDLLIIPYLCEENFEYDGDQPFLDYPETLGWIPGNLQTKDPEDPFEVAKVLQKWCFFGLLTMFFKAADIRIETADFVNQAEGRVTTYSLEKLFPKWTENIKSMPILQRTSAASSLESCLRYAQMASQFAGSASNDILAAIGFSISAVGATLTMVRGNTFSSYGVCPVSEWNARISVWGWGRSRLIVDQLLSNGWCRSDIFRLYANNFSVLSLGFAAGLPLYAARKDHTQCTEKQCNQIQIDENTYETQHRCSDPTTCCSLGIQHEEVCRIIHRGGIPIVCLSKDENSSSIEMQLVEHHSNIPFVAISHVWADGLGNVTANSLPECQLRYLYDCVAAIEKIGSSVFLWIDTLCVPARGIAENCPRNVDSLTCRSMGITGLETVYRKAGNVLVLDKGLTSSPSNVSAEECMMRIVMSAWTKRLWTYQEGRLSTNLYIQFQDQACMLEGMIRSVDKHDYHDVWLEIINEIMIIRGAIDSIERTQKVASLWNALQPRSTSWSGDEAICLSILLGLDTEEILKTHHSERMFKLVTLLDTVPAQLVFMPGPRLQQDGYGWAPTSFLGRQHWTNPIALEAYKITHGDSHTMDKGGAAGFRTDEGLLIRYPGFLLSQTQYPLVNIFMLVTPDEEILGVTGNMFDVGSSDWEDGLNLPNLGLLASAVGPGNRTIGILVSDCSVERGIVFAKYRGRFWYAAPHGEEAFQHRTITDEETNVTFSVLCEASPVKPDQLWCIG